MKPYAATRRKRLVYWLALYLLLLALFGAVVYWQSKRVNTLEFASGAIKLSTSKTSYTVGDTVSYTITNGLSKPLTLLSACPWQPLHVYTWKDNAWARIQVQANDVTKCASSKQSTIGPGKSLSADYANWSTLFNSPGIYRIVLFATNYPDLAYADFQVVPKPVPAPTVTITQKQIIYQPVYTPVYIPIQGGGTGGTGGGGDD